MNHLKKIILALLLTLPAIAMAVPQEREVQIGLTGAFAPVGLRADSNSYVVVNGIFQNGCYKWSRAEVAVTDTFVREIKAFASVSQGMCIMVLIPFQKDVNLGKLASGQYTLRFLNGDGTYLEKTLVVE